MLWTCLPSTKPFADCLQEGFWHDAPTELGAEPTPHSNTAPVQIGVRNYLRKNNSLFQRGTSDNNVSVEVMGTAEAAY